MPGRKKNVSVFIPVKNEELNIGRCLEALSWAGEIFVVDSHSADRTVEEAERRGAQVCQFEYAGDIKKDDWALENLPFRNEWLLSIDADEIVPSELAEEILDTINRDDAQDGYYIGRRLIFMGRWLRHCGLYPSRKIALFKYRLGRYESVAIDMQNRRDNKVHEHLVLRGTVGVLKNDLIHEDRRDLYCYIDRHNYYSDWDSQVYLKYRKEKIALDRHLHGSVRWRRLAKRLWVRLPFRPALRFIYMYFARLGFLDGAPGLHYCLLRAVHEYHISVKLKERLNRDRWLSDSDRGRGV